MSRALAVTAALILAAGLAGCGKVGQLERPGPMFRGFHGAASDADDHPRQQDPSRPVSTIDPRDRNADAPPPPIVRVPEPAAPEAQPAPAATPK